jgi:hypothetical protein
VFQGPKLEVTIGGILISGFLSKKSRAATADPAINRNQFSTLRRMFVSAAQGKVHHAPPNFFQIF